MNFNPYGLGVWSGLPIWLSGWLALMSLDAPTNNRVLATLICTWTSGAVAIGGCVMAVFDHLAAGCKNTERAVRHSPIEPFTILEPQKLSIDVSALHKKR